MRITQINAMQITGWQTGKVVTLKSQTDRGKKKKKRVFKESESTQDEQC